jgi:hypothetical protein
MTYDEKQDLPEGPLATTKKLDLFVPSQDCVFVSVEMCVSHNAHTMVP